MNKHPFNQPPLTLDIYRFHDWIALSCPFSARTFYLTPKEAENVLRHLNSLIHDVAACPFGHSTFKGATIKIGDRA